ncbi:MAG: tRNA (adenosine(37)-N6)-threonylcarbamoyltransferase complex dimerization subunit type 1 TsaB [Gammaproteobacteria bacterium]|nr:MAG: tRNA (adenosine(37)-N6)-threonylcarbamoyltransferase complex dimerization subunit type 1 TsaB [Gammaproteobacteria bacterium]
MNILAIDTATEACSAALYLGGEPTDRKITSTYQLAPREHSRLILKMIDGLLKDKGLAVSDLDAIAFGRGPGSFMGLRIAAGVVQGIAFSHDIPVIPISTLKVIALCAYELTQNKNVLVAIDARMDEVYWAAYYLSAGQWLLDGEEKVISPDKIQLPEMLINKDKTWVGAGTGWGNYADRLLADTGFKLQTMLPDCLPTAAVMVQLAIKEFEVGNMVCAAEAIPIYLRNDVAKKPKPVIL